LGLVTPGTERIHRVACMVAKCEGPEATKTSSIHSEHGDTSTSYYDHGLETCTQT